MAHRFSAQKLVCSSRSLIFCLRNEMAPATTHSTGGDDLDDGFELDQDLLANSEVGSSGSRHDGEEDGEEGFEVADGEYDNDDGAEDDERPQTSIAGAKRKAADAEDDEESRKAEKRLRKKEKEKLRRARVILILHLSLP